MENENFCRIVKDSGYSLYKIAKSAGIPYTTVNQLYRGKTDINHVQVQTVFRMACLLGCHVEDLMNRFDFLSGATGTAQGISYTWGFNGRTTIIQFQDSGRTVILDMNAPLTCPSDRKYYGQMADMSIEDYLQDKKDQEIMKGMLNG